MKASKLQINGRTVLAVVLAGTLVFVSGVKKHTVGDGTIYRMSRPIYEQDKGDHDKFHHEEEPAILPEEPNYEVVLEKKRRRKNGKWVD